MPTLLTVYSPLAAIIWMVAFVGFIIYLIYALNRVNDPNNYEETDVSEKDDLFEHDTAEKDDAFDFVVPKKLLKESNPIQLYITNNTDEIKTCNLLEIFNKNPEGVELKTTSTSNIDFDFIKRWLLINPSKTGLIRLHSQSLTSRQAEQCIHGVSKNPMGQEMSKPVIIPIDDISPKQYQSTILDNKYEMELDGLSEDFEFKLLPKVTITFTLFLSQTQTLRKFELTDEKPKDVIRGKKSGHVFGIIVENTGDNTETINLIDKETSNPNIQKYDLFGNFSSSNIGLLMEFKTNSIRVFVVEGNRNTQVNQPIAFEKSGNTFYAQDVPDRMLNFQSNIIDINLPADEEFGKDAGITVTILPKTRVVYLFKHIENMDGLTIINPSAARDSKQNQTEEPLNVELFTEGKMTQITATNVSIDVPVQSKCARINYNSIEQMEQPLIVKKGTDDGYHSIETIYPLAHVDVNSYNGDKSIDLYDFEFNVNGHSRIETTLPKKGDTIDISLYDKEFKPYDIFAGIPELVYIKPNASKDYMPPVESMDEPDTEQKLPNSKNDTRKNWFPIWIENTTDTEQVINLVNNMEMYEKPEFALPAGVKLSVKVGEDWGDLLRGIEATNGFKSLELRRVYIGGKSEVPTKIYYNHFKDGQENPDVTMLPNIANYFSANQFQSKIIDLHTLYKNSPYHISFKYEEGESIKSSLQMTLQPNSRVAIFAELMPC